MPAKDGTGDPHSPETHSVTDHDLAELAQLSYAPRERIEARYGSQMRIYRTQNARAILLERPERCVVAFTGTDDLQDVRSDIRGHLVPHSVGRVHAGFLAYLLQIWGRIRTALLTAGKPVIFCGHSLGAAAATIAALDWCHAGLTVERLVTFGSPRVGDAKFAAAVDACSFQHARHVACSDVVTRIPRLACWPLPPTPYRHCGTMIYLACDGQRVVNPSRRAICWDRATGRVRGILAAVFRGVSDHSMAGYARRA